MKHAQRWGPLLVMVGCGGLSGLGFEPTAWWPCFVVGVAAMFVWLHRARSVREAAGWGYAYGFGLNIVSLTWLASLLPGAGPVVALLLVAFMSVFMALMGAGFHLVRDLPGAPVWSAAVWVAGEWLYSRHPFGGFGWIRAGYAMVDAPVAGWLPWLSVAGTSFVTVLLSAVLAFWWRHRVRWRGWPTLMAVATILVVLAGGVVAGRHGMTPTGGTPTGETVNIGMVQGDVESDGNDMGRARSVTNNHYAETIALMADARAGHQPMPDLILWPENSTDIDPVKDRPTRHLVQSAVQVADVPILVGAVTAGPGVDERQTTALWWMPDGTVADTYHKRDLVPFGEYIPFRDQLLPLIPVLSLVGAQSIPGTEPGVLDAPLMDGRTLRVGDVICFELAYDDTVRDAVRGSTMLVVQSNNATYRGTAQIDQQFAITRVRAMEARREIVVATTNSVSGHIAADGTVLDKTQEMRSASQVYTVPLRTDPTWATRFGGVIEQILAVVGAMGLVLGAFTRRRRNGAGRMVES